MTRKTAVESNIVLLVTAYFLVFSVFLSVTLRLVLEYVSDPFGEALILVGVAVLMALSSLLFYAVSGLLDEFRPGGP